MLRDEASGVFTCISQPYLSSLLFEKQNINSLFGQVLWLLTNISIAPSTFIGLNSKENCAKRKKRTESPHLGSRKLPLVCSCRLSGWLHFDGSLSCFHYLNKGCTCSLPLGGDKMLPTQSLLGQGGRKA